MIILYGSGPNFGLPDASPFVTKALILLKLSGLPFTVESTRPDKAPKGKIPFISDGGLKLGDSTFIRWHLEKAHGVNFDAHLSEADKARLWAFEKMAEDQIYWAIVSERWMIEANFDKGPKNFFAALPPGLRQFVCWMVRRNVRNSLRTQGFGRHSRAEMLELAAKSIAALATELGTKDYFGGAEPCGADATLGSFVMSLNIDFFESPLLGIIRSHPNLVAYDKRIRDRFGF